mgnify:CR=1 FL=1
MRKIDDDNKTVPRCSNNGSPFGTCCQAGDASEQEQTASVGCMSCGVVCCCSFRFRQDLKNNVHLLCVRNNGRNF